MIRRFLVPKKTILLVFLLLVTHFVTAQHVIQGKVTDSENRQPLAFVNIVVNDGESGGMTDIDGRYSITNKNPITKIKFSYLGYEMQERQLSHTERLNVALFPIAYQLNEITVNAGENPAHRIIDSVVAHRRENNPDHLDSYSYNIYDKMAITVDSSSLANSNAESNGLPGASSIDSILKKNDLLVMETYSQVLFMSPDRKRQNVIGTKISGMKDPVFVYLVNGMQSISFYDETVEIASERYVNPLSQGSKKNYFFTLEDVTPIGEGDSLYIVSFHPYKGSNIKGLKGSMTIHSDGWALKAVKAEPAEKGGLFTAKIQQLYEQVEGQWFPRQYNTNLVFESFVMAESPENGGNTYPMAAVGKSYVTDITLHPDLKKKDFSEVQVMVDPAASSRDEAFWVAHRIDSMNQRTQATHAFMDSLTRENNLMDRMMNFAMSLMDNSTIPIGVFDFDIDRMANISVSKGFYLGLGVSSNDRLSTLFKFSAYAGYWTRLKTFDYGSALNIHLDRQRQAMLVLSVDHKSEAIGEFNTFREDRGLLSQNNYKYAFFENLYMRKTEGAISVSSRFAKHFKGYLTASVSERNYLEKFYYDADGESVDRARLALLEAKVRFAYKEKFLSTPKGIQSLGTTYPIVWFSYQHAFKGIFGSEYEYDRFKFQLQKSFYTRYWGVTNMTIQSGLTTEGAPVAETFDILGTYSKTCLYAPGSFSTMRFDEFFSDRFVALYLSHNFSGMLWQPDLSWCKPQLVLVTNMAWGDMRRAACSAICNFKTMEKGYYESGVVIEGLLDVSLMQLGAGFFYRYGPYSLPTFKENMALKWSVIFNF